MSSRHSRSQDARLSQSLCSRHAEDLARSVNSRMIAPATLVVGLLVPVASAYLSGHPWSIDRDSGLILMSASLSLLPVWVFSVFLRSRG